MLQKKPLYSIFIIFVSEFIKKNNNKIYFIFKCFAAESCLLNVYNYTYFFSILINEKKNDLLQTRNSPFFLNDIAQKS